MFVMLGNYNCILFYFIFIFIFIFNFCFSFFELSKVFFVLKVVILYCKYTSNIILNYLYFSPNLTLYVLPCCQPMLFAVLLHLICHFLGLSHPSIPTTLTNTHAPNLIRDNHKQFTARDNINKYTQTSLSHISKIYIFRHFEQPALPISSILNIW